jgi:hypothetical protein
VCLPEAGGVRNFPSAFPFSFSSFRLWIIEFQAGAAFRTTPMRPLAIGQSAVNLGRRNSGLAPEFLVVWVVVRFFELHTGLQPRILAELTAKLAIYRSFRFNLQFM